MNKLKLFNCLSLLIIFASSCSTQSQMVSNQNVNQTNIELNRKNFKVVDSASGRASMTYIFGIGGLSRKALMESAKLNMYAEHNLIGKSSAYTNLTTESRVSMFLPFYYKRTIITSALVVEFVE